MPLDPGRVSELAQALCRAERVLVLTGSGISAESGVPTFRDAQTGLWARFRPEDLATPRAFRENPRRVWEWYAHRRELVARAEPNPGHRALAELESVLSNLLLVTQNVDSLHQRAGSRHVIELHGNLARTLCSQDGLEVTTWDEPAEPPPRCPRCAGLLRPGVVWFEEALPAAELELALSESRRANVLLSIGTSSLVYPAALLPHVALASGALVVEVNPEPTELTPQAGMVFAERAGVILPALMRVVAEIKGVGASAT